MGIGDWAIPNPQSPIPNPQVIVIKTININNSIINLNIYLIIPFDFIINKNNKTNKYKMNSFRSSFKKTGTITNNLIKFQSKQLHKSFRPTFYNLRHYFSNLRRNDHGFGKWDMIYGPDGFEKVY